MLHGQDELAYLLRVLRNTFLTQRRTASRRPQISGSELDDVEPVDPRTGARPEQAVETREVISRIAALSEDHRLALVAVDVLGLSYREAARALRTREATIASACSAPASGSHATSARALRPRSGPSAAEGAPRSERPEPKQETGNMKGSSGVFTTEGPR